MNGHTCGADPSRPPEAGACEGSAADGREAAGALVALGSSETLRRAHLTNGHADTVEGCPLCETRERHEHDRGEHRGEASSRCPVCKGHGFTLRELVTLRDCERQLSETARNAASEAATYDIAQLAHVAGRLLMLADHATGPDVVATLAVARQLADAFSACVAAVESGDGPWAVEDAALAAREAVHSLLAGSSS